MDSFRTPWRTFWRLWGSPGRDALSDALSDSFGVPGPKDPGGLCAWSGGSQQCYGTRALSLKLSGHKCSITKMFHNKIREFLGCEGLLTSKCSRQSGKVAQGPAENRLKNLNLCSVMVFREKTKVQFRKRVGLAKAPSFRVFRSGGTCKRTLVPVRSRGTSECILVLVSVPGEHPPKPPFWKTTLLVTPDFSLNYRFSPQVQLLQHFIAQNASHVRSREGITPRAHFSNGPGVKHQKLAKGYFANGCCLGPHLCRTKLPPQKKNCFMKNGLKNAKRSQKPSKTCFKPLSGHLKIFHWHFS